MLYGEDADFQARMKTNIIKHKTYIPAQVLPGQLNSNTDLAAAAIALTTLASFASLSYVLLAYVGWQHIDGTSAGKEIDSISTFYSLF